ncbi:MAG TPA: aspartate aminotransferase family protein [Clostridiaceae bacterium]|nr:aspartate aminotransferase family protein [Clostridiaceae bacterium]
MELIDKANKYFMETYAQLPVVLVKGNGSTVYDTEGNSYIDFTSGVGVNSLGYGDKEWMKAVAEQSKSLAHISNIFYNLPSILLAEKLVDNACMSKVFFSNSGAEANEGAIKLARKYSFDKYGKNRSAIITLKQSFHGRTVTTLSATGQEKYHDYFFPFTDGFKHVKANDYDDFINNLDSSICAVMMEAIQGEGGVIPLEADYVKKVVAKCKENDIAVIFDEIQCGIGRTGLLFGYNHFDAKPDIVTVAKGLASGLPMGAVLCNEKLGKVFKPGDHGSTFGANPVASAAALAVLDKICNKAFMDSVITKGDIIKEFLKNNCNTILEVRGKGLMIGIQIQGDAAKVQKEALSNGLLVLTAGPDVIRLLPPLVINEGELVKGLEILCRVIDK